MKIEKRKVSGSTKLSTVAKGTAASALGMTTLFSFNACAESDNPAVTADSEINSSSSSETGSTTNIVDIPQTHTPLSSSATEAVNAISSSSAEAPQSSSEEIQPLAGDPIITADPASSSSKAERPAIIIKDTISNIKDTLTVPNVHLCKDPNCLHEILIQSMVTTFEMDDILV